MAFGGYRLLNQVGAGRDGISYRAFAPDGQTPVEVCDLSAARADPERWPLLTRHVRLAAQFDHPGALRVLESALDQEPPFVAIEWREGATLGAEPSPLSITEAFALIRSLAGTLAEAHRIGLAHGRLGPGRIKLDGGGRPGLDFTGVEINPPGAEGIDEVCRAPEDAGRPSFEPSREGDVFAVGSLLVLLLTGSHGRVGIGLEGDLVPASLAPLLSATLAADPGERPTARELENALRAWLNPSKEIDPDCLPESDPSGVTQDLALATIAAPSLPGLALAKVSAGLTLGRFRLLEVLGAGGQGVVYRAEDTADGSIVALKVLRPEWASRPESAQRFRKEARLLAEVNNPYVVNLLEHNEDGGVAYLVMEFVTGRNLADLIQSLGKLDEPTALAIAVDVARALEDAHGRGIVHRDVKPANILLPERPEGAAASSHPRVKLSDFGLARHVVDSESLMLTAPGAVMGTPHYMAPEQGTARPVDPRTDIYALGATMFHMLAGRPPFDAETREQLNALHGHEPPPPLRGVNAELSDGICQVVGRALAKSPEDRYPDAAAIRRDLERLTRGEPTGIPLHPILPECDPKRTLQFEFRWELESSPRQLWPHVTNTDRLDKAIGFTPVRYSYKPDPTRGVRQFAEGMKAGMPETWEEHPYEWVEPRRMGVLREYSRGPFHWLVSVIELIPRPEGGTTLVHRLRLEPRGWKSRVFSPLGVGVQFRAALGRVYGRIDATVAGKLGPPTSVDPFEAPEQITGLRRERLESRLDALAARWVEPAAVERLGDLLTRGAAQDVARIRSQTLARQWGLDPESVLATCLHAAREGLLVVLWDILCPSCRLSCEVADTLRAIREHGRCEACQLDFQLDFAGSVELIFRAHPEVREADTGLYCAGGPAHAPHVLAQVRVAPGERFELELTLSDGTYRLRGPQLPWSARFRVQPSAATCRLDVDLTQGPTDDGLRVLRAGGQVLVLDNPGDRELLTRVERETARDDALTATRALAFAPFRDMFPGEVLSPGQLVSVTSVTLLLTDLESPQELYETLGDAQAFEVVHEHFMRLDEAIRRAGGTLVKTVDEGVVASFLGPEDAVAVGLDLQRELAGHEKTRNLKLRVSVHRGAALVATLDGRLDYFGTAARKARRLLRYARGCEIVLTPEVAGDPRVAALLHARGLEGEVLDLGSDGLLHRLTASH